MEKDFTAKQQRESKDASQGDESQEMDLGFGKSPGFVDNRPEIPAQRKLQDAANMSAAVQQHKALQQGINMSAAVQQHKALQQGINMSAAVQQHKALQQGVNQSQQVAQYREHQASADQSPQVEQLRQLQAGANDKIPVNDTGMPDELKQGVEGLSGMSMDHVRVHYNSDKPAAMDALAYAQGGDIHLGPGQEQHLPHEAWHVVQQMQGRVKPTLQMKGIPVNDAPELEREADVMGAKAIAAKATPTPAEGLSPVVQQKAVVQRVVLSRVYKLNGGGNLTMYYSTYDPTIGDKNNDKNTKGFKNYDHAVELDAKLEQDPKKGRQQYDPAKRYPTNYTYFNTNAANSVDNKPQGPHTVSHCSLSFRLNSKINPGGDDAISKADLLNLITQQIPNYDDFETLLNDEWPVREKDLKIKERNLLDYQLLWKQLNVEKAKAENILNLPLIQELMMRLMQMDPYTVYGKGKTTNQKNIKGKGENKEDHFEDSLDEKNNMFKNKDEYENFKEKRKLLFEDNQETQQSKQEANGESSLNKKAKKVKKNP